MTDNVAYRDIKLTAQTPYQKDGGPPSAVRWRFDVMVSDNAHAEAHHIKASVLRVSAWGIERPSREYFIVRVHPFNTEVVADVGPVVHVDMIAFNGCPIDNVTVFGKRMVNDNVCSTRYTMLQLESANYLTLAAPPEILLRMRYRNLHPHGWFRLPKKSK